MLVPLKQICFMHFVMLLLCKCFSSLARYSLTDNCNATFPLF